MRGSARTLACSPDRNRIRRRPTARHSTNGIASSRFTARRYSAFSVRAPSPSRDVRRFGPVLRTVVDCLPSFPVSSGYSSTATARRPADWIAIQRLALRAIAPCSGIIPSRIVSRLAKRRYAPLSPVLHSPSPANALPCRLPLRRHSLMTSASPYSRLSSPHSRNRSLAASRSDLDRIADSGSLPAAPASVTGLSTNKIEAQTKKVQPNRPDDRFAYSRPLQSTLIHVERTCHGAPTCCVNNEDRAMQPTCVLGRHGMEKATLHTCAQNVRGEN